MCVDVVLGSGLVVRVVVELVVVVVVLLRVAEIDLWVFGVAEEGLVVLSEEMVCAAE